MRLWRIVRRDHAGLDGEGARLYGARWNSPGAAVSYAASHLSLAALEYLVHVDPDDAPDDLVALRLDIPEEWATALILASPSLPPRWQRTPSPPECRRIGDRWARNGQHLLLQVPSVLIPEESNLLVNPMHRDAPLVHVSGSRPFSFDPRLPILAHARHLHTLAIIAHRLRKPAVPPHDSASAAAYPPRSGEEPTGSHIRSMTDSRHGRDLWPINVQDRGEELSKWTQRRNETTGSH